MRRRDQSQSQGRINEAAALKRAYAEKRRAMAERERARVGSGAARVGREPYLDPATAAEKDACIAGGATTPRARDAIVRRMRS